MRGRSLALAIAAFLVGSVLASACVLFENERKVPLSFSVRVTNDYGPVVGLTLRVTDFREAEYRRLPVDQRLKEDIEDYIEVIATATTDAEGVAHFSLHTPGRFNLGPAHPGGGFARITLIVAKNNPPAKLSFKWPQSTILETKLLRGRLSEGLTEEHSTPVTNEPIVHDLITNAVIAKGKPTDDGSFDFGDFASGLYSVEITIGAMGYSASDYIPILIDANAPRDSLAIAIAWTTCGLMYDLEENKARYKPEACFKGGKSVPCGSTPSPNR